MPHEAVCQPARVWGRACLAAAWAGVLLSTSTIFASSLSRQSHLSTMQGLTQKMFWLVRAWLWWSFSRSRFCYLTCSLLRTHSGTPSSPSFMWLLCADPYGSSFLKRLLIGSHNGFYNKVLVPWHQGTLPFRQTINKLRRISCFNHKAQASLAHATVAPFIAGFRNSEQKQLVRSDIHRITSRTINWKPSVLHACLFYKEVRGSLRSTALGDCSSYFLGLASNLMQGWARLRSKSRLLRQLVGKAGSLEAKTSECGFLEASLTLASDLKHKTSNLVQSSRS